MIRVLIALLLLAPAAAAHVNKFTVRGTFQYEDKEWDFSGWTGVDPLLPVRHADVLAWDAVTHRVLGRGVTGEDGSFEISCKTRHDFVDVQVRCDTSTRNHKRYGGSRFTRIRVVSSANAIYSAFSTVAQGHDSATDLDVGTTVALAVHVSGQEGNPFNLFDMAISTWQYITGPQIEARHSRRGVAVLWPSFQGSYAWKHRAWIATDDGYDDAVILHEIGHLVHNVYSDSDNPGGVHYFGDSDQDPRLSFGEGFATFLAGAVMNDLGREAMYVDSHGGKQVGGFQLRVRLETAAPYLSSAEGASDELAVACALYDMVDDASSIDETPGVDDDGLGAGTVVEGRNRHRAWWEVFRGPVRRARAVTLNHAWDGWFKLFREDPVFDGMVSVFETRGIRFWNDAVEPDNGKTEAQQLLATTQDNWSSEHTLYFAPEGKLGPGTGDRDWYAVDLTAGTVVDIETRYPDGAWDAGTQVDTYITLYDPSGKRLAKDDDSGTGRNARIAGFVVPESGTWRVKVSSRNKLARYGRYEVRVRIVGAPE